MSQWHNVEKDGLPEECGTYIVFIHYSGDLAGKPESFVDDSLLLYTATHPHGYVSSAHYSDREGLWHEDDYNPYNAHLECVNKKATAYISHWMPLPEEPEDLE